ncbi:MAG: hypothetical protein HGB11_15015 [Chlorobiales bacterium]|jgi:hypothetical protein|nr:hypothetical protein [Chlorobiales bacterium]
MSRKLFYVYSMRNGFSSFPSQDGQAYKKPVFEGGSSPLGKLQTQTLNGHMQFRNIRTGEWVSLREHISGRQN